MAPTPYLHRSESSARLQLALLDPSSPVQSAALVDRPQLSLAPQLIRVVVLFPAIRGTPCPSLVTALVSGVAPPPSCTKDRWASVHRERP